MSSGEIALVVLLTVVAMLGGACVVLLALLSRSIAAQRRQIAAFERDSRELLDDLEATARHAAAQVDRVDRLVVAAETVEGRVDAASRLAQRTFQNPVVKALALREGVRGASHRLRVGSETRQGSRGRSRGRRAS